MVKFLCLGSGSSGNCYWLGDEKGAILIDAGINFRAVKKILAENKLAHIPVRALFITHDHTDHIRAASMISNSYGCPVYSTNEVHRGMEGNYGLQKKIPKASQRNMEREEAMQVPCTAFSITCFPVPHDSHDNVGYRVTWMEEKGECSFCLVTDCGYVTDDVRKYMKMSDHVVIESNHDVEMLMNGSYPHYLKLRVRGQGGHLSNDECAGLLREVWHKEMQHIFLCHLSADNNTPDLAYKANARALMEAGAVVGYQGVTLCALPRTECSKLYCFGKKEEPVQYVIDFG
ncbi:MAG: MBL fold metallo-hydrolase [Bacteroidales bacterium]|nr:MBL fold metallo-hydrolase [Bacteroidales bacterium]